MTNNIKNLIGLSSAIFLILLSLASYFNIIPLDTAVIGMLAPAFIAGAFLYASKGLKVQTKIIFGIIMRCLSFMVAIAMAGSNINILFDTLIVIVIVLSIAIGVNLHPTLKANNIYKFLSCNLGSTFICFSLGIFVSTLALAVYYHDLAFMLNQLAKSQLGDLLPFVFAAGFFIVIVGTLYAERQIIYQTKNKLIRQKFQGGAHEFFNHMQKNFDFLRILLIELDELDIKDFLSKQSNIYDLVIIPYGTKIINLGEISNVENIIFVELKLSKNKHKLDKNLIKHFRKPPDGEP